MFRTFRSPTVLTATRCVFGCTISWSGLDAPGIQSQSSTPRLMCGASGEEKTQTLEASPRGAAAVLRLTIDKLCKELGVSGESVKDDIAFFVREDVDARVQKVLDAARIIESNAVPPGQIGLGDDRASAETLSGLVNLICEKMIMEPMHLQALYTKLREGARNAE